jgi:hypothetical protein
MVRAQALLKGCTVHWERNVLKVARDAHYVPSDEQDDFRSLCDELRRTSTMERFRRIEQHIRQRWKEVGAWLDWWMNPSIGRMIFEAFKIMDPTLSASLPNESTHYSIYQSVGKGHQILAGLEALLRFAQRLQRQSDAVQSLSILILASST